MAKGEDPGVIEKLVRFRRSLRLLAVALAGSALFGAVVEVWSPKGIFTKPPDYTPIMNVVLGLLVSGLAATVANVVVVGSQIGRAQELASLALLAIEEGHYDDQVVVVVPEFNHDLQLAGVNSGRPAHPKDPRNLDKQEYSRRDVLLACDVLTKFAALGLRRPRIISDRQFMEDIADDARGGGASKLTVRDGSDEASPGLQADIVLCVGLWSNDVSRVFFEALQSLRKPIIKKIPLPKNKDSPLPDCRWQTVAVAKDDTVSEARIEYPEEPDPFDAVVARCWFGHTAVVVLGGNTNLATARVGDLISRRSCDPLWDVPAKEDLWAQIVCPGKDRRWTESHRFSNFQHGRLGLQFEDFKRAACAVIDESAAKADLRTAGTTGAQDQAGTDE